MGDRMQIEITESGVLKITTDVLTAANHANAEAFLAQLARDAGGKDTTRTRRSDAQHTHSHAGHEHSHA